MIPLTIQLKNFLSYGPDMQTINFSHHNLICLSGKNGHGKSALLDAITWALWGQARKTNNTAKADNGLLHLGQTHMIIIFDFLCNNQHYRIRREYAQTYGKPYAALEFGIVDTQTETVIPLTDKTIRATQQKIEQTLHITFDAFTNSAFLRQGQANEFSKKSPKERKEILAAILGLNHYETLRKQAQEKIRVSSAEKNSITAITEKIQSELTSQELLSQEIATSTSQMDTLVEKENKIKTDLSHLLKEKKELYAQQKEYEILTLKYEQISHRYEQKLHTLHELRAKWRTVEYTRRTIPAYHTLENEKKELLTIIHEQQKNAQKKLDLKGLSLQVQEQIQQRKHELITAHAHRQNESKTLVDALYAQEKNIQAQQQDFFDHKKLAEHEYAQSIQKIADKEDALKAIITPDITQLTAQFERRKDFYHRFLEQGKWYHTEYQQLVQKQQLVHEDNDPSCPLCEQNLSASRKRFLKNKFTKSERFLTHRIARLTAITKKLKKIVVEHYDELQIIQKQQEQKAQLKLQLEEYQKTKNRHKQDLEVTIKKIEEKSNALILLKEKISAAVAVWEKTQKNTEKKYTQDETYTALQNKMTLLEQELAESFYDEQIHSNAQKRLDTVEHQRSQALRFEHEFSLQSERLSQVQNACKELKELKKELKTINQKKLLYKKSADQEKELSQAEQVYLQQLHEIMQEKEQLIHKKGSLEQQKNRLNTLQKEYATYTKKITLLEDEIDDYYAIAQATSKDGIQALLIEDAIPEIEHEANQILARLSENQAQIIIESLRDLKKGGTKETLDIKISDSIGMRPYELFSGGEAFRIDFALRIAISKLLARRAGTSLQTLIIDEGFGSQDEEGLAHIMDAIYTIQEDFSKVIIVSHLTAMKEQFPVHFMIEKSSRGSTVTIIEQG